MVFPTFSEGLKGGYEVPLNGLGPGTRGSHSLYVETNSSYYEEIGRLPQPRVRPRPAGSVHSEREEQESAQQLPFG